MDWDRNITAWMIAGGTKVAAHPAAERDRDHLLALRAARSVEPSLIGRLVAATRVAAQSTSTRPAAVPAATDLACCPA
ncbi:MAG TPA: hypothetical protein VGQ64_04910 [Candidatus Limnocylindrales bacterium]|jgi:hypothetical protein|nr:hypothetical protein [Candidatus Limnocylindrales bacterium]